MPTQLPDTLSTPRLRLQRISWEHEDLLFGIHSDERVAGWLAGSKSKEQNRDWVDQKVRHWTDHGFGLYVFLNDNGQFVGRGGLLSLEIDGEDRIELNYSVAADHWGQGIATEAGSHLIEAGFRYLGLDEIVAFTLPTNLASQRVMQKVGMTYQRDFIHHKQTAVLYRIAR
tara:strand:+ start:4398 stop:4910 length:513 start_codon:yes stop_codon:yes gene_type:complete